MVCSYGTSSAISVPLGQFYMIQPPKCQPTPSGTFTTNSELPPGYTLNPATGLISGIATGEAKTYTIIVSVSSTSIVLNLKTIPFAEFPSMIPLVYYESSDRQDDLQQATLDKILNGEVVFYSTRLNSARFECATDTVLCGPNLKSNQLYYYTTIAFEVTAESETIEFDMNVDDRGWYYLDNMNTRWKSGDSWDHWAKATETLSRGTHFIFVVGKNLANSGTFTLKWKRQGDSDFKIMSPSDGARGVPPPLQYVEWRSTDLLMIVNEAQTLTPVITGYMEDAKSIPDLPKGLSMDEWGKITGAPSELSLAQPYGLSMTSWDKTFSVVEYITIRVLANSAANMALGLDGLYYSSPERGCDYRPISSDYDNLKFRRFDKSLPKQYNMEAWPGLSGDFINQFTVVWTGLLKVDVEGDYVITSTTYGGIRIKTKWGNEPVIYLAETSGCGTNGMFFSTRNVHLLPGFHDLEITYWKSAGNSLKMIQIQWECAAAGISKRDIPDENFLRIPRYSFSYEYETAEYVKNVEITPNCPIYNGMSDPSVFTKFSSSPPLPQGLTVNSDGVNKGCVTGKITADEETLLPTYFTIIAETVQGVKLQSRMTLSYKSYEPVTSVVFTPATVTGTIDTYLEITPVITGNYYTVQVSEGELPAGLSVNTFTGAISGIPTESVTSRVIKIKATNALGGQEGTVTLTITGCAPNNYFLQFAYITGLGRDLSVLVTGTDSSRIYSNDNHQNDTYYSFRKCISSTSIVVTFTQPRGRVGTYIISQEGKKMLKYGKWSSTQITTFIVNVQNIEGKPTFKYTSDKIAIVTGEYYELYPEVLTNAITEFSTVSLPPGLSLNTTNGLIYGTVGEVDKDNGIISITAKNGQISSDPVTIEYSHTVGCAENHVLLRITIKGGLSSGDMTLRVVDSSNNEFYAIKGVAPHSTTTYSECKMKGSYSIYYGSTNKQAWDVNSYITVQNRDEIMSTLKFKGGEEAIYSAVLSIEIPTAYDWEYSQSYVPKWNGNGQKGWNKAKPGSFFRTGTTMYYRTSITLTSLEEYSSFSMKVRSDGGLVGYINGFEFYRVNMPEGQVSNQTLATSGVEGGEDYNIIALPSLLSANSENYISFETHKTATTTETSDPFHVRMAMLGNSGSGCETMYSGTLSVNSDVEVLFDSTTPTSNDFVCRECAAYMFDVNKESKAIRTTNNGAAYFVLKLTKAVYFNTYYMVTANDCTNRDPSAWTIYGTNTYTGTSSDVWVQIHHVDNPNALPGIERYSNSWTDRGVAVKFEVTNGPRMAFRYLKYSNERTKDTHTYLCGSGRMQLADFYPAVCSVLFCPPSNPFPSTKSGSTAMAVCTNNVQGTMTRVCNEDGTWGNIDLSECNSVEPSLTYPEISPLKVNQFITPIVPTTIQGTIMNIRTTPALPNDLSINPITGVISGFMSETINPSKTYEILGDTYEGVGALSISIELQTALPSCPALDGVPETPINEMVEVRCDRGFSGKKTRFCLATNPPSWDTWDTSACVPGEPPDCSYPKTVYELGLYTDVTTTLTPTCTSSGDKLVSAEIDSALPTGLSFDEKTGAITGTPSSPLRRNVYTVKFKSVSGGFLDVQLEMTIWGRLTKCNYIFVGDINVISNVELSLQAPRCNFEVQNFTATDLPAGLSMAKDGVIEGTPTTVQNYTVKVKAANPVNSISFNVKINVLNAIKLPKLFGKYTKEVYYNPPDPVTVWKGLDEGTIEYEWADSPDGLSNWEVEQDQCTFGSSVKRSKYYCAQWKGYIELNATGSYEFKLRGDDRAAMFIDTFDNVVAQNIQWDHTVTFTKQLTAGIHPFGLYYYQGINDHIVHFHWKVPGSDEFQYVPDSVLFHYPELLTVYSYPSSDYVFIIGVDIGRIVPDVQGSFTEFISKNSLPDGLSFDNAIITGKPTTASKRTKYTFKCTSQTTTIETSIYITIVKLTKDNLLKGLIGSYYTYGGYLGCSYVDVDSGGFSLKYQRTIPTYYHPPSTEIWTGLSGEFSLQFAAKWTGYLDVPEAGSYTFTVSGMDGVRFEISGNVITPYQSCQFGTGYGNVELEAGLNPIKVNFWKTQNNAMTSISVQWEKFVGSTVITKTELPTTSLYHIETSSFSYEYSIASYTVNVKIADNSPVFFHVSKDSYTSFYVEPPLPKGINLNTKSGVISGTPKKAAATAFYTVTTTHTDGSTLSYALSILVNPYSPPMNLTYTPITGSVGEELPSNTPSLGSGENVRYSTADKLPIGITLDAMTGAFSGIPSHSFTGTIRVKCSNPSGSIEAEVQMTINSCADGKVYVAFEYDLGNREVGITLVDSAGTSIVNIASGSLSDYAKGEESSCLPLGAATLTITSAAKVGGIFRVYIEGELLRIGAWNDGSDTINYQFQVATVTGPSTITAYSLPDPLYAGVGYSFYPTLSTPATSFEITGGVLPDTLSFDSTTGVLKGSILKDVSITITPINRKEEKGTPFLLTITQTTCSKTLVGVKINAGTSAEDKSVQFKLQSAAVNLLDLSNIQSNTEKTYMFCEESGAYMFTLGSTRNKHWSDGTLVTVLVEGVELISLALEYDRASMVKLISLNTLIDKKSEWQVSSTQPKGGWYNEYVPNASGWTTIAGSDFTARNTVTTYYRTKFDYSSSISTVAQLQLSLKFDAGIICYLNGNEFYRRNLPMTGVSNTVMGNEMFNPPRLMSITVGKHLLQTGTNYFAVEVHKHSQSTPEDPLLVLLTPLLSVDADGQCSIRTLASSAKPTMDASTTFGAHNSYPLANGFDWGSGTYYKSKKLFAYDFPGEFVFKWPVGKAEFFNTLMLKTPQAFMYASDMIDNMIIYGAFNRDNPEWLKIREFKPVFPDASQFIEYNFEMENNVRSFEAYRIEVISLKGPIDNSEILLAEAQIQNCKPAICAADGDYKETVANNRAFIKCPAGQYGYREKLCYKIPGGNTAAFLAEEDHCSPTKATTMTYGENNILTFYTQYYGNYTPTINGGIDSYSIDCILPGGIIFNPRYGRILGLATEELETPTVCTVTGYTGDTSFTSQVTIHSKTMKCLNDGLFETTEAGTHAKKDCGIGYEGIQSRYCDGSSGSPVWSFPDRSACKLLPPTIEYSQSEYIFNLNDPAFISPVLEGAEIILIYSTALPTGLTISPNTGVISGTTVSATPPEGIEITVTVMQQRASATGKLTIIVRNTVSSIKYDPSSYIFHIGFMNQTSTPTLTGSIILTYVIPTLPPGLGLDVATGVISGTPFAGQSESRETYRVQGIQNSVTVESNEITIEIIQPKCESIDSDYPTTNAGVTVTADCPEGQSGSRSRTCSNEINPKWSDEISTCQEKPKVCEAADGFPETSPGNYATLNCDAGYSGKKQRYCGYDRYGNPAWQNIIDNCVKINPSITYRTTEIIQLKNTVITPITPVLVEITGELRISPSLPPNFQFDTKTGTISGSGLSEQARKTYTVTATGNDGKSYTATIGITITENYATSVTYPETTMKFYVNIEENNYDPPIANGVVKTYSINPSLPSGLRMTSDSGKIYGKVAKGTAESTKSYVVSAAVSGSPITTTITIQIIQPKCPTTTSSSITWPETNAGESVKMDCPSGYDGSKTRICGEGKNPVWGEESGSCNPKLPSFSYPKSSYSFTYNEDIGIISPQNVVNGPITTWSSSCTPTLEGIEFSTTSGSFSGKAIKATSFSCRVIGSNSFGSSNQVSITFTITLPKCSSDGKWPATDINKYAQVLCDEGYGMMIRHCSSDASSSSGYWGNIDKSQCRSSDIFVPDSNKEYVKMTMTISNVVGSLNNIMKLAVQVSIAESLNLEITTIHVEEHISRLRLIQSRTVMLDIYIKTSNPSSISSEISSTTVQQSIRNKLRNSEYTSAFKTSSVSFDKAMIIEREKSSSKTGAIVGGVFGGIFGFLLIAFILIFFLRNHSVAVRRPRKPSTGKSLGVRVGVSGGGGDNYNNLVGGDEMKDEKNVDKKESEDEKNKDQYVKSEKKRKAKKEESSSSDDDSEDDDSSEEETAL